MASIYHKVPNLLGGVSQQPDPVKLNGQVREAENVYLDPTFGCRKRPPTKFIAQLGTDISTDAKWFTILKDQNERYAVCIENNPFNVKVFDLNDGTSVDIDISSTSASYFDTFVADDIKHLTIADYTLISNKAKTVAMRADLSPDAVQNEALVSLDAVVYNSLYAIDINGEGVTTPTSVTRASKLEIIPASQIISDSGSCSEVDADEYILSDGAKSGLAFRIANKCTAFNSQKYIKSLSLPSINGNINAQLGDVDFIGDIDLGSNKGVMTFRYVQNDFIPNDELSNWQYTADYTNMGITRKIGASIFLINYTGPKEEFSSQSVTINIPSIDNLTIFEGDESQWYNNSLAFTVDVSFKEDDTFYSRYNTNITLKNGGQGWVVGDKLWVSLNSTKFLVRVSETITSEVFASEGSAVFVTPANTDSGGLNMEAVTTGLVNAVNQITNYTATSVGGTIKVTNTNGDDFGISVRGGSTNSALRAIKGLVPDVAALPDQCFAGMILKVANTEESQSDDYFVKFETDSGSNQGTGAWVETVAPSIPLGFDTGTLPQALVRLGDGTFYLGPLDGSTVGGTELQSFADREVGDEETNPEPTFVGNSITNMCFYSNRFGFLSKDSVILSQPSDYFNFFIGSALTISDIDPIDVAASSRKPSDVLSAVAQPQGLLLFSEHAQFMLSSDEVNFSVQTVKMNEVSQYFYRSHVDPVSTGKSVIFLSESDTYTKAMEMIPNSSREIALTADITRVVPQYIPPNLLWGESSPNNNLVIFGDKTNAVYTFKFFDQGNERQLAGWSKWLFNKNVLHASFEDDKVFIIEEQGGVTTLATMNLVDDNGNTTITTSFNEFTPRLDNIVKSENITITHNTNDSTITLPTGMHKNNHHLTLVSTSGESFGTVLDIENIVGNDITIDTDIANDPFIIGHRYISKVVLPNFYIKKENVADRVNIPVVEYIHLHVYAVGGLETTVSRLGYDDFTFTNENENVLGSHLINELPIDEIGDIEIPVFCKGSEATLTILGKQIYPFSINSYTIQGHYNNKGISTI